MLNKPVLLQQLQELSSDLFLDINPEIDIAYQSWQRICNDKVFAYKIAQNSAGLLIPHWYEDINACKSITNTLERYSVLAVDGSQIYPDKHQGTSCFLVNIGSVLFHYQQPLLPAVTFNSRPFVFVQEEAYESGTDFVDCKRQELELEIGFSLSCSAKAQLADDTPFLFLFDGSLIFWHLESKNPEIRDLFLNKYLNLLHNFYDKNILCAGYISLPKSKELVNLIRIELANFSSHAPDADPVAHLVDATIARFFLKHAERSTVFKSNAKIGSAYPSHLMPHFFYYDIGQEIVRIEIPAWIAKDEEKLHIVAQIILNQVTKGRGYPVAIAEAHEQAVIKGADRDLFYQLITKFTIDHGRSILLSQKNIKKRGMAV